MTGVEAEQAACHIEGMTSLERCLQSLTVLIQADDVNGVGLMEQAVDAYLVAEQPRGLEALHELKEAIISNEPATSFREHVVDYVDQKRLYLMTRA